MTVREAIALCKGRVYIGIRSGFVAIDDSNNIIDLLEEESVEFEKAHKQKLQNLEHELSIMPGKINELKKKADELKSLYDSMELLVASGEFSADRKKNTEMMLKSTIASKHRAMEVYNNKKTIYPQLKKYMENWEPIPDRRVISKYEVHDNTPCGNDGTIIICTGIEKGKYWSWDEVLEEREKI